MRFVWNLVLVENVKEYRRMPFNLSEYLNEENHNLMPIVNQMRSDIPAVTHVDYSVRIQPVGEETNPYYYNIIKEFKRLNGCGVIVNISFNVRGEPIVCSLKDAYECFMWTNIDVLVLENYVLLKEEQASWTEDSDWREKYELD